MSKNKFMASMRVLSMSVMVLLSGLFVDAQAQQVLETQIRMSDCTITRGDETALGSEMSSSNSLVLTSAKLGVVDMSFSGNVYWQEVQNVDMDKAQRSLLRITKGGAVKFSFSDERYRLVSIECDNNLTTFQPTYESSDNSVIKINSTTKSMLWESDDPNGDESVTITVTKNEARIYRIKIGYVAQGLEVKYVDVDMSTSEYALSDSPEMAFTKWDGTTPINDVKRLKAGDFGIDMTSGSLYLLQGGYFNVAEDAICRFYSYKEGVKIHAIHFSATGDANMVKSFKYGFSSASPGCASSSYSVKDLSVDYDWGYIGGAESINFTGSGVTGSNGAIWQTMRIYYTEEPQELPDLAAPEIKGTSPFFGSTTVTIDHVTDSKVYYTKDGETPDVKALPDGTILVGEKAILYSGPFTLDESAVITAVSTREGYKVSNVVKKEFAKFAKSEKPAISGSDVFAESAIVTIIGRGGDKIYYTLNGSDPVVKYSSEGWSPDSEFTLEYSSPLNINDTYHIKAIAISSGNGPSDIVERQFVKLERSVMPKITGNSLFLDKTTVSISGVAGERFFYTLDGSDPEIELGGDNPVIKKGVEYTGPFDITESGTLKVVGLEAQKFVSLIVEKVFKKSGQASEVEISGTTPFVEGTYISISAKNPFGSKLAIYYTTDGSEPAVVENAGVYQPEGTTKKYESELILSSTTTVKALLTEEGLVPGSVAQRTFYKVDKSELPVINGEATFIGETEVEITAPENAEIFYTTDGTNPEVKQNEDATKATAIGTTKLYEGKFTISSNTEVKAVSVEAEKFVSDVASKSFIRIEESVAPEIIAVTPFYEKSVVEITAAPGAEIYYTLDGSKPAVDSPSTQRYESPFPIESDTEIRAIAIETGKAQSIMVVLRVEQRQRSSMPRINVAAEFEESTTVSISASERARVFFTTAADQEPSVKISDTGDITFNAPTQEYSAPFEISSSSEIKALSVEPGMRSSEVAKATSRQMDKTEAPVIEGETPFAFQTEVTIKASSTSRILYTLDGSAPSWQWDSDRIAMPKDGSSTKVLGRDGVIQLSGRTIVRAIASESGKRVSDEVTLTVVPMDATPAPKITGRTSFIENTLIELNLADVDPKTVKFFYTLDGSEPRVEGLWGDPKPQGNTLLYSNPVSVTSSTTLKAIAWQKGKTPGATSFIELVRAPKADAPVIEGDTDFTQSSVVTISSQTGSRIFYSIDGSAPWGNVTEEGVITGGPIEYTAALELKESSAVKAVAVGPNLRCSDISEKIFNKKETALSVIINAPELFGDEASVELRAGAGATIYYTLDGSLPDKTSNLYTAPFKVYGPTTVKTISFEEGKIPSAVSTLEMRQMERSAEPVINGTSPFVREARIELSAAPGATIYYTLDGTLPDIKVIGADEIKVSENSKLYSDAFVIDKSCVVKAIAIEGSKRASAVTERSFTRMLQSKAPVISGVTPFETTTKVEIAGESGSLIFYTTDGSDPAVVRTSDGIPVSDPSTSTKSYTGSFEISESCVIKAIAADASHDASEIASKAFTKYDVSEPVVIKAVTHFGDEADVEMTASQGAKIYYTLDNSEPTEESTLYEGVFVVKEGCTIRAIAIEEGKLKSVEKALSIVQMLRSDAVVISGKRRFSDKATITLSAENGASIYYTLDGSVPTAIVRNASEISVSENAILYDDPITITASTTIEAIAIIPGKRSSLVSVAQFEYVKPLPAPVISGVTPFETTTKVEIAGESGSLIFYTTDGSDPAVVRTSDGIPVSDPSTSTKSYTGSFEISESCVIKAISADASHDSSEIASKAFTKYDVSEPVVIKAVTPFGDEADVEMTASQGAKIYYTLDNSEPTEESTLYESAFVVKEGCTIKAIAIEDGKTHSVVSELVMKQMEKSAEPVINGTSPFVREARIELSAAPGATIYYTLDGTLPDIKVIGADEIKVSENSKLYSDAFVIDKSCVVKAIAIEGSKRASAVTERSFTRMLQSKAPVISGVTPFETTTKVEIAGESGSFIFYTTDGSDPAVVRTSDGIPVSDPSTSTKSYTGSFEISESCVIKAIAADASHDASEIASRSFTKYDVSEPVVIKAVTPFGDEADVEMTASQGAKIYYTIDGSQPTESSTLYSGPFVVSEACVVKAIAIEDGKTHSVVSELVMKQMERSADVVITGDAEFSKVAIVELSSTPGSRIFYTIDGSMPQIKVRNHSDLLVEGPASIYSGPIEIEHDTRIKALSIEDGKRPSLVTEREFIRVGNSQVKIIGNEYFNGEAEVTIIAEEGAYVFYTLDGTDPVAVFDAYGRPLATGTTYVFVGSLTIKNSVLLKARGAWPDRLRERIAERLFKEAEKSEPVRIDGEASFEKSTLVSIIGNSEDKIFYSTDGSTPAVVYDTEGNPSADGNTETKEYIGPFEIHSSVSIKAIGVGRKKAPSEVTVMEFVLKESSWSSTIIDDGSEVKVVDGRIVAPADSKVYSLTGMDITLQWKQGRVLEKGIYVVIVPLEGTVPKRVKIILK